MNSSDSESEVEIDVIKPDIRDYEHPEELISKGDADLDIVTNEHTLDPDRTEAVTSVIHSESLSECTTMSSPQLRSGRRRQRAVSASKKFVDTVVQPDEDLISEQVEDICSCSEESSYVEGENNTQGLIHIEDGSEISATGQSTNEVTCQTDHSSCFSNEIDEKPTAQIDSYNNAEHDNILHVVDVVTNNGNVSEIRSCQTSEEQDPIHEERLSHEIYTQTSFLDQESRSGVGENFSCNQFATCEEFVSSSLSTETDAILGDIKQAIVDKENTGSSRGRRALSKLTALFASIRSPSCETSIDKDIKIPIDQLPTTCPSSEDDEVSEINDVENQSCSSNNLSHSFRPIDLNMNKHHDLLKEPSEAANSGDNVEEKQLISEVVPNVNRVTSFSASQLLRQLPPLNQMKFVDLSKSHIKYNGSFTRFVFINIINKLQT